MSLSVKSKLDNLQKELNDLNSTYLKRKSELVQEGAKIAESNLIPQFEKFKQEKERVERELQNIIANQQNEIKKYQNNNFEQEIKNLNQIILNLQKEKDQIKQELDKLRFQLKSDLNNAILNNKKQLDNLSFKLDNSLRELEKVVKNNSGDLFKTKGLSMQFIRDFEISIKNELKLTQSSTNQLTEKIKTL